MGKWIISCEHGGNKIPAAYVPFFDKAEQVLQSHRGYDPGAYELFQLLSKELADFSLFSHTSRLLVELNRSLHHPSLFSSFTKNSSAAVKKEIIASYYLPYRKMVEEKIQEYLKEEEQVIHLSIHSFTPELNGEVRNADVGLLYDPSRKAEKSFCVSWKENLKKEWPNARIRMNYPYQGKADGFTTYLRKRYQSGYIGIELELNQKHAGYIPAYTAVLKSLQHLKEEWAK
ncbi:N-formylglutamate amidohydrolase [Nafulsella turpanensis]|uniref:N-formylglutamate amidohydrolase n=1 Tax=Nafulsella turpanensis TaxID=1265690 RepID=UPI00034DC756|nr:N-formylglutamate amidohydrolase [Nafulsella turpanensis]